MHPSTMLGFHNWTMNSEALAGVIDEFLAPANPMINRGQRHASKRSVRVAILQEFNENFETVHIDKFTGRKLVAKLAL